MLSYIEARVGGLISEKIIGKRMGLSEAHIREVFKSHTGKPLSTYIRSRRLAHAAYELSHTERRVIDISADYAFTNPDSFARAFKRELGYQPSAFRRSGLKVGRVRITGGVYGPGILDYSDRRSFLTITMERHMNESALERTESSCILYGVQRVQYREEECTPFPACLRSCLNYLGQDIDYCLLMAATGASFRLRWNEADWDGGNVDIMCIYDRPEEALERGFAAAGRHFALLKRNPTTTKIDFTMLIQREIDAGRPLIALGIIGPPEACIITGYRDKGNTLLGWNFFQENPEFASGVSFHDYGYFECSNWWENPNTCALIAIAEDQKDIISYHDLLRNALDLLTREHIDQGGIKKRIRGGQAAYKAWAAALLDKSRFTSALPLPKLFEALMCQIDAMTMVGEGRAYAACFLRSVAKRLRDANQTELSAEAEEVARHFDSEFGLVRLMGEALGGFAMGESQARALAKNEVRSSIVHLIEEARTKDKAAADKLRTLLASWPESLVLS